MTEKRQRLDLLLVERGLVSTRAKARARLMAGEVFVDGSRADKPGKLARADADVEVVADLQRERADEEARQHRRGAGGDREGRRTAEPALGRETSPAEHYADRANS